MQLLTFKLQDNPPKWAKEALWYYENVHGEQWIASIQKNSLVFSGLDIGWKEIKLTPQQALDAYSVMMGQKYDSEESKDNPLNNWILDKGERLWVASVLYVAIEQFKMNKVIEEQGMSKKQPISTEQLVEMITAEDIRKVIESIKWSSEEEVTILDVDFFSNSYACKLDYKKGQTWHEYTIFIDLKDARAIPIFTFIKNGKSGNNVSRNVKTTIVTDKLLFALITYIRDNLHLHAYPDYFEVRRFIKHLAGKNYLCSSYVSEAIAKGI
ncbi:hypothetical protein IEO70_06030 [Bacillus sp. AGMB 02131]|uniref:Uncharacterized protein n=1 Tax=Peribacillus faecalis TaxID=2772559 RepID=A0A927HAH1_9BACI|nr:hypothetical protein [Peribacillus faecalis]MBD3107919.1 hypothetical protein [Peribacillus faecalis]